MMSPAEPTRINEVRRRQFAARLVATAAAILRQRRFLRFLLVGGFNTAVGYSLLIVALAIMPTTLSALFVANILAILFNFMTMGSLVFGERAPRLLPRFFGVYAIAFVYNAIGLTVLENMGIRPWLGGLLILPSSIALSYLLNQRFVFGGPARALLAKADAGFASESTTK
jgi:putative flippase GtrA